MERGAGRFGRGEFAKSQGRARIFRWSLGFRGFESPMSTDAVHWQLLRPCSGSKRQSV